MKSKFFRLLLITSPFFWALIFPPRSLLSEWAKTPVYIQEKFGNLLSDQDTQKINRTREAGMSRILSNKPVFLAAHEFEKFITLFSPRIYFQAGTPDEFSPRNTSPMAEPLFLVWIAGLIFIIRNDKKLLGLAVLTSPILAYITDQRNFAFLFPVAVLYLYTGYLGLKFLPIKYASILAILILFLNCLYVFRVLWLG